MSPCLKSCSARTASADGVASSSGIVTHAASASAMSAVAARRTCRNAGPFRNAACTSALSGTRPSRHDSGSPARPGAHPLCSFRRMENDMAAGRLWVIATPIGNLDDLSPRAAEVLRAVALIAAEDTRHSAPLLARVGSTAKTIALHEHNEREQAARIVEAILAGRDVALISDAGTPLVSDPGYRLVRAVREAGAVVSPVPGPCAAIAALSVAGLASDRF